MNPELLMQARSLTERAQAGGQRGLIAEKAQVELLNQKLGGRLPPWYAELISTVPLCHLQFGWQSSEPDSDDDGISWLSWLDVSGIEGECLQAYPGIAILMRGYICVGGCLHGSGDQYFIAGDSDDPPLYRIDHEAGATVDLILARGRTIVARRCLNSSTRRRPNQRSRNQRSRNFTMKGQVRGGTWHESCTREGKMTPVSLPGLF